MADLILELALAPFASKALGWKSGSVSADMAQAAEFCERAIQFIRLVGDSKSAESGDQSLAKRLAMFLENAARDLRAVSVGRPSALAEPKWWQPTLRAWQESQSPESDSRRLLIAHLLMHDLQ